MKPIKDLFGEYKTPPQKRTTERSALLEYFANKINPGRIKDGYKPLDVRGLNFFVQHLRVPDLYYMKSICDDAEIRGGSFGAVFFGSLKVRNSQSSQTPPQKA